MRRSNSHRPVWVSEQFCADLKRMMYQLLSLSLCNLLWHTTRTRAAGASRTVSLPTITTQALADMYNTWLQTIRGMTSADLRATFPTGTRM